MERTAVTSSLLRSVGYDASSSELEVETVRGTIYRYRGVPEFVYRGLMLARSKGEYFNRVVVDRYPFTVT